MEEKVAMLKAPSLIPRAYISWYSKIDPTEGRKICLKKCLKSSKIGYLRAFLNIFSNILMPLCRVYKGGPRNVGPRINRRCF